MALLYCIVAAVMASAVVVITTGGRRADRQRTTRFAGRPTHPEDELLSSLSLNQDELACAREILRDFAAVANVEPGQLRLDDRFDRELAPVKGWEFDDELYIVIDSWLRRADKRVVAHTPVHTLKDLVLLIGRGNTSGR